MQRGLGVRGSETDAPARGDGLGGPLSLQDRVQIGAVRPQDRRDQRRHALQIARRPERDGANQRQASSEKGVEDADARQVPSARVGLREQDEDGRHERGEQRVVDAAHRDSDPGEPEEHRAQHQRFADMASDERGDQATDHGAAGALQRATHGCDRVRLKDEDDGHRHPVAALEPERGRQELGKGGHEGDAQGVTQLGRRLCERIAQRGRPFRKSESS